jgi:glutathione S-transferase
MSETLILHHYEASPYAEKIRLMLGLEGLRWRSVSSPPQPPRPNVDPLSGGYRRIPIGQIGADVFCDTFVIAQEVARLADAPELDPERATGEAAEIMARAEGDVFFAAIGSVPPLTLLGTLVRTVGPIGLVRFALDRARMMQSAHVKPAQGDAARKILQAYLDDLEQRLSGRDYLTGATPSIADFAAFHPLWLHVRSRRRPLDPRYADLGRWYARIEALGHGAREEWAPGQAFEAARSAKPRPLPSLPGDADVRIGRRVSVAPTDYGTVPVTGTLVAVTPSRCIVARDTDRFGRLHVHFPLRGFALTEA